MSDGQLDQDVLSSLPDDELMAALTAIPGIGPWTVQGAMIVALGREAIRAAYQLGNLPTPKEVLALAEKWRPYRSLATSYLFSAAFEPTQRSHDRSGLNRCQCSTTTPGRSLHCSC